MLNNVPGKALVAYKLILQVSCAQAHCVMESNGMYITEMICELPASGYRVENARRFRYVRSRRLETVARADYFSIGGGTISRMGLDMGCKNAYEAVDGLVQAMRTGQHTSGTKSWFIAICTSKLGNSPRRALVKDAWA